MGDTCKTCNLRLFALRDNFKQNDLKNSKMCREPNLPSVLNFTFSEKYLNSLKCLEILHSKTQKRENEGGKLEINVMAISFIE